MQQRVGRTRSRGDTIVEVMIAFAVFSAVAMTALFLMNRGMAISQRSLEITQVRAQIDSQAEMVRYIHDEYLKSKQSSSSASAAANAWTTIKSKAAAGSRPWSYTGGEACPASNPSNWFAVNPTQLFNGGSPLITSGAGYQKAAVYSRVDGGVARGIFAQVVQIPGGAANRADAYDVYIQACWDSVGGTAPVTTGTIVRLYEPK